MSDTPTTTITPALLRALRADIDAALAAVGAKHCLTFTTGSASYNRNGLTGSFKLELAVTGGASREEADFREHAALFHLAPDDLHRRCTVQGQEVEVIGAEPGRSRTPILVLVHTGPKRGKKMLYTAEAIAAALGHGPSEAETFAAEAARYGFAATDYGRTAHAAGSGGTAGEVKLVAFKAERPDSPVVVEYLTGRRKGKRYLYRITDARRLFGLPPAPTT